MSGHLHYKSVGSNTIITGNTQSIWRSLSLHIPFYWSFPSPRSRKEQRIIRLKSGVGNYESYDWNSLPRQKCFSFIWQCARLARGTTRQLFQPQGPEVHHHHKQKLHLPNLQIHHSTFVLKFLEKNQSMMYKKSLLNNSNTHGFNWINNNTVPSSACLPAISSVQKLLQLNNDRRVGQIDDLWINNKRPFGLGVNQVAGWRH